MGASTPSTAALLISDTRRSPNRGNKNRSRLAGPVVGVLQIPPTGPLLFEHAGPQRRRGSGPLARRFSASGSPPARATRRCCPAAGGVAAGPQHVDVGADAVLPAGGEDRTAVEVRGMLERKISGGTA